MRVAVATDSNSGITQEDGKDLGIYVLPMPFTIDGQEYLEGVDLTQEEFYARMENGADISTSQPSPEEVTKFWDKLLEEYDQVVYIPMSSGLSGSCQTAKMLEQDYEGKVAVVNNHRISVTQRQSALDALELSEMGWDAEAIRKKLEEVKEESTIYIVVDTLKYLKKGGRITPAAATLGTLLKIKPVLAILGEKLDAFAKARTVKQAKSIMISAIQKDLEVRLSDPECKNTHMEIAYSQNEEAAISFREELKTVFPETEIYIAPLSLSIGCHVGPGSMALAISKKLEV